MTRKQKLATATDVQALKQLLVTTW